MDDRDKPRFADAITECATVYGETLTPERIASYWRLLSHLPIEAIESAIDAHMRDPERGRFFPRPADIIAAAQRSYDDGHPTPEEAWAIAVTAEDEDETVVWTDEIAQAWGVARPILALGDRIGARQAFVSAYQRLVNEARAAGRAPRWTLSPGRNAARRRAVVEQAVADGRISADRAKALLPPPDAPGELAQGVAGLLTGKVTPMPQDPKARARLAELRKVIHQAEQRLEAEADARRDRARRRRERIERERARQLEALCERMEGGDGESARAAAEAPVEDVR